MIKDYMIDLIHEYQYYPFGVLETMSESEVREIYERLIDWIGG